MSRISKLPIEVDMISQLADLKEVDYKNTLMIAAIVEILVEKRILTRREVLDKANQLDSEFHLDPEHDTFTV